jgi:uncharacterized membrane protein
LVSLTVWRYPTPLGVDAGELRMKSLQEKKALTVHDAVAVIWMPGAEAPRIRRLRHDTAKAVAGGSILGGLVGLVVLGPVGGAAAGAAVSAVTHRLRSVGINDEVVDRIRNELTPGTSALLVLSSHADVEKLRPLLARREATLIHAELSEDAPAELRLLLEEEE